MDLKENIVLSSNEFQQSSHEVRLIRFYFNWSTSLILFIILPVLTKIIPLPSLLKFFLSKISGSFSLTEILHSAAEVSSSLDKFSDTFHLKNNYCLRKSLVLFRFLQKYNIHSKINIGMKFFPNDSAIGHCWISINEENYFDKSSEIIQYNQFFGSQGDINYWISINKDISNAQPSFN